MRITFSCKTSQPVSTSWRKNIFFTEHLPLVDSRYSVLFYFRIEKGRRAFEEEENEVLQRNIKENSNNIVQNQEQEQQLVVLRL